MLWRVQYTTKGLIYCILSVICLATVIFTTSQPNKLYQSIEIRDLHNEALFHPLEQLVIDWSNKYITDIHVTDDRICPGNYTSIFTRKWLGTISYCQDDVPVIESGTINTNPQCLIFVQSKSSVGMSYFNGKTICAKLSDLNYLHTTRVDPDTLKCPGVYVPCSDKTSPQNTVCVHPEYAEEHCPITFLGVEIVEPQEVTQ